MSNNMGAEKPLSKEMARSKYESFGTKARRALSKAAHTGKVAAGAVGKGTGSAARTAGSLGQAVIETKAGKIIAAVTLGLAATQTPVGKDVTHRVVEGAQGAANTVSETFDNLMSGPKFENDPFAIETAKVIHNEVPLRDEDKRFAHDMTIVSNNPNETRVYVYPINSNVSGRTLVFPIGSIPVGTEFNRMLITEGTFYHTGINDPSKPENHPSVAGYLASETYGAVDCNTIASVLIDSSGNKIPDIDQKYPACFIPSSNLQKASK